MLRYVGLLVCRGSDMTIYCNIIFTSPNGHGGLRTTFSRSPDGVCAVLFHVFYMF